MGIKITEICRHRWSQVIHRLASNYGFPAERTAQLETILSEHTGYASTFRITGKRWRFVIDTIRRGEVIVDIVAISLIARHSQDERHNGAVITRACDIHPDPNGGGFVGAPHLRWVSVTSGGESYQLCCDKECNGPDKSASSSRGNWESTRLRIIQKAYEQEILALKQWTSEQAMQLSQERLYENTREHIITTLQHEANAAGEETETLRARNVKLEKENSEKAAAIQGLRLEIENLQSLKKEIKQEQHKQMSRVHSQCKTTKTSRNRSKRLKRKSYDPKISSALEMHEVEGLKQQVEILENNLGVATSAHSETKRALDSVIEQLKEDKSELEAAKNALTGRVGQAEAQTEKMNRKKIRMEGKLGGMKEKIEAQERRINDLLDANTALGEASLELQHVNADPEKSNASLQASKEEAIALRALCDDLSEQLESQNGSMEEMRTSIHQLESKMKSNNDDGKRVKAALEQAQQDLADRTVAHASNTSQFKKDVSRLKKEVKDKDATIGLLQYDLTRLQSVQKPQYTQRHPADTEGQPLVSAQELSHQRNISREAHERASDAESKLEAMKLEMEAMRAKMRTEKVEMEVLAKKAADTIAAADSKNSYTASLEKNVEEMRGVMENVLGQVSIHQGRKRRRTEGPDFRV